MLNVMQMGLAGKRAQWKGKTFLGIQVECSGEPKDWMKIVNFGYV